jgi:hypothetical protein
VFSYLFSFAFDFRREKVAAVFHGPPHPEHMQPARSSFYFLKSFEMGG